MRISRDGFWLVVGLVWFAWITAWLGFHALKVMMDLSERRAEARYQGIERLSKYAVARAIEDLETHLHDSQKVTFPCTFLEGNPHWIGVFGESGSVEWLVSGTGQWGESGEANLSLEGLPRGGVRVPRMRMKHPDKNKEVEHFWAYWIEDIELSGNWPGDATRAQFWKSQLSTLSKAVEAEEDFLQAMAETAKDTLNIRPVPLEIWISGGIYAVPRSENSIYADVRLRYYFGLQIYNPWQEALPLEVKTRGAARPVWQWVAGGMAKVRLHNETLGYSSDWISLDDAVNEGWQREQRIAGWVESVSNADFMAAGDIWAVTEPDLHRQPEGLSRLLYRSFPVRPADEVIIEFSHPKEGINIALYGYEEGLPAVDYETNEPLWRIRGIPFEDFSLYWPRADEGHTPFLRGGRSADFRREDTSFHYQMSLDPQKTKEWLFRMDPRRRDISWHHGSTTHSGFSSGLASVWTKQQFSWSAAGLGRFNNEYGKILRQLELDWNTSAESRGLYFRADPAAYERADWQMLFPEQGGGLGLGRAGYGFPHGEVHGQSRNSIVLNTLGEASWIPYLYHDRGYRLEHAYKWLEHYRQIRSQNDEKAISLHSFSEAGWIQEAIDRLAIEFPQENFDDQSRWFLADDVHWIPHGRLFRIIGYGEKVDSRTGETLGKNITESWHWLE